SKSGLSVKAEKIDTLDEILKKNESIVGIDEIHMFEEKEARAIASLLKKGIKVFVSGLDMDYRGKMFPIVQRLFELGPQKVNYKRAVCEICKEPEAIYTQIYQNNIPITSGVPSVIPEDGTYVYRPVCYHCFRQN
ncbi:MAG: thymidine kinase, partial [Candidatus Paceibacterota bacterium]